MVLTVVFGTALPVAVPLPGPVARSVLAISLISLLFLLGGAVVDDGAGIVVATTDPALFTVLFTDGTHVCLPSPRTAWLNPLDDARAAQRAARSSAGPTPGETSGEAQMPLTAARTEETGDART